MAVRPLLLALAAAAAAAAHPLREPIERAVQPAVDALALKYDCAISVGIRGAALGAALGAAVAAGRSDRATGRQARTADKFVWGSVTKLITGASVLRLVDQGVISLSDPVPPLVDPFLERSAKSDPTQNFTSLADLWGPDVAKVTVKDLLGMRSGVPDYDTASPGSSPTDSFRALSYAKPSHSYTPTQLLSVPWVRRPILFPPGTCNRLRYFNCYSSSNYVLLGLLLANHFGASRWEDFKQAEGIAPVLKDFSQLSFALSGAPSAYTPVHGYDTTHYNHNTKVIDVTDVAGVFAGWTASDLVADALDIATLGQDIYGPENKLVSKPLVDLMYSESAETGYGLATFNLSRLTPHETAYGHLGATYGYQSIIVYIPSLELSIAIATNIERDYQDQPQDVFCSVFNIAKAILHNKSVPTCKFTPGYYTAKCICS